MKIKAPKTKGILIFGIINAILCMILLCATAFCCFFKKDGVSAIYIIIQLVNSELNYVVYAYLIVALLAIVLLVLSIISMLKKNCNKSGNTGFLGYLLVAVFLYLFTNELNAFFGLTHYFINAFFGISFALDLSAIYKIVVFISNKRFYKKGKKALAINVLGLIINAFSIIIFLFVCIKEMGFANIENLIVNYNTGSITALVLQFYILAPDSIAIWIVPLTFALVLIFVPLAIVCFLTSIAKIFYSKEFVKNSKYFSKSSPITCFCLVLFATFFIEACKYLGILFGFQAAYINNSYSLISLAVIFALFIAYFILITIDKRKKSPPIIINKTDFEETIIDYSYKDFSDCESQSEKIIGRIKN